MCVVCSRGAQHKVLGFSNMGQCSALYLFDDLGRELLSLNTLYIVMLSKMCIFLKFVNGCFS